MSAELMDWGTVSAPKGRAVSRRRDEAPAGSAARGFGEIQNEHADSSATVEQTSELHAAIKARAKRANFELLATRDGSFYLCRWGHARRCETLAAVQAVLDKFGVQA